MLNMKSALSDEDDEGASHVDFELGRSSLRYVPLFTQYLVDTTQLPVLCTSVSTIFSE